MKQASFGLPAWADIPPRAYPAYRWLLAQLEKGGIHVLSHAEARNVGAPLFEVQITEGAGESWPGRNQGQYRIESHSGKLVLDATGRGIRAGLGEIATHILHQAYHRDPVASSTVPSIARGNHWAVRCPPEFWEQEHSFSRLDFLASLGFDTICLEGFGLSSSMEFLVDEHHPGIWESKARPLLEQLQRDGWFTVLVLPVQLDMGMPKEKKTSTPPCRMIPEQRRRMLHRFEAILSGMNGFDAIGMAVSDWPRCSCAVCEKTSFEEEVAYYLRAFMAVMKRHTPGAECWILPDGASWNLLQEIRAEFPDAVRILVPFVQDPDEQIEFEGHQPEAGLQIDLSHPGRLEWFDPAAFDILRVDWDQEGPPDLLSVSFGDVERYSLQLLSLMQLLWERDDQGASLDDHLHRISLPIEQWQDLPAWKAINREIGQAIHQGTAMEISSQSDLWNLVNLDRKTENNGNHSSISILIGQRASFLPDLSETLLCSLQRLELDRVLDPIIHQILALPEGRPLDSKDYEDTAGLVIALADFLSHPLIEKCYEKHEQRVLENLRDRLSLLVSEIRNRRVWDHGSVPDFDQWLDSHEER